MWYVFEGGDLTGKSTLVREFAQYTGFEVFHPVRPSKLEDRISWKEAIISEMDQMEQLTKTGPEHMIMDRTVYVSDPVYAPIFDRMPKCLWEIQSPLLDRALTWKMPHIIIYCYANIETKIQRNFDRKEEKYSITEQDHEVVIGYDKILKQLYQHWQVVRVNTSHSKIPECVLALLSMLDYLGELRCEQTHLENLLLLLRKQTSLIPISIPRKP